MSTPEAKDKAFIKRTIWIIVIITVLQAVVGLIVYPMIPEQIPVHWGIDGQVNRYGDKWMIFQSPMISALLLLYFIIAPKIDPFAKNFGKMHKAYGITTIVVALIMLITFIVMVLAAFDISVSATNIITAAIGIMFIFIGNYLPQAKRNFFMGIRLPWTLLNDEVWAKTHRFGGIVFVIVGFLFLLGMIFPVPYNVWVPIGGCFLMLPILIAYSFMTYKKVVKSDPTEENITQED